MITCTPTGEVNFEDFTALVQDGRKADLIDGIIDTASPEGIKHNTLVSWLDRVMGTFVEERGLGELTANRVAYRLSERQVPGPDIAVVLASRVGIIKPGHVDGPPDLPGLWIDTRWLWQRPLPRTRAIVDQLLSAK